MAMMQMLATPAASTIVELASLVWMELAMFAVAFTSYAVVYGSLPLPWAVKKAAVDDTSEGEKVARELLTKLATGDNLAVYKLWQRAKCCDQALGSDMILGVIHSMRQLGRCAPEISMEFGSALECNSALCDPDSASVALKALRKEGRGSAQLHDTLYKVLIGSERDRSQPASSVPDLDEYISEIRECGRTGKLDDAFAAFERLRATGATIETKVHNSLLDACVQCRASTRALKLFTDMKAGGVADVVSYNIVLKMSLGGGRIKEAEQLMKQMSEQGFPANAVTYNEMLNALAKLNNVKAVWELVGEMQKARVSPSPVTCSILLKLSTRSSGKEDFDRTMSLVSGLGGRMDEVLFASVVEACVRLGRLDILARQTRRFAEQGGLEVLSPQTYGSLFKAYGQARDVERLWDLWTQMEGRQVRPTSVTLGCFIDALVKNLRVENAWDVVNNIAKDPTRADLLNNIIYSTVLKGFAMTKQIDRLFSVYGEMRQRQVAMNTVTYNTLFDACARCGCMDRTLELVADMRSSGIPMDTISYSTLVKGHCFAGSVDAAFDVLKEMRSACQQKPDEIMYNSILDGCAKEHRTEDALVLFEEMKREGVRPSNYTLCTLVKLLGRVRQLPQAFNLVDELCAGGLRPNIQVYTCLMTACIDNRQLDRALQLHDQVIRSDCQPDQRMYSALVRGCLRVGSVSKACEVLRCAFLLPGHGFASPASACGVDAKTIEDVVVRLKQGNRADCEMAQGLIADLKREHGLTIQDNLYAQVVRRATAR